MSGRIAWVDFAKGQRKDDVMAEHLAGFAGEEGVVFIGQAQEKTPQVSLIFGRRLVRTGPRATPGRFRTRVITSGVTPSLSAGTYAQSVEWSGLRWMHDLDPLHI